MNDTLRAFVKQHTWTVAFAVLIATNLLILHHYNDLNDDFRQSLTESCETRSEAREAYRFIIQTTAEGHPREAEILKYTEENLPPVECP